MPPVTEALPASALQAYSAPPVQQAAGASHDHLAIVTETEAAKILKVAVMTVRRMRWAGTGPRYVKLSERRIGYRVADINAWLDARTSKAA